MIITASVVSLCICFAARRNKFICCLDGIFTQHFWLYAVVITLPDVAGFDLTTIRDVEVRVGNTIPTATNAATANAVCASTTGPASQLSGADLGSPNGNVVRIPCDGILDGTVVTVRIK